ncbi:MAG: HAMP domain-containing histidine kinase [Gracilibacteraceae bacterium]|jgi:signal transduction histidine kinase|nr:HAMP domain-containing histidine kinase [Gracilibacteraceae bacterium]
MNKKPLFVFNLQWIILLLLVCILLFLAATSYFVLDAWNSSYRASLEGDAAVAVDEYNAFFREQINKLTSPANREGFRDPGALADYLAGQDDVDFYMLYAGAGPLGGSGDPEAVFLRLFEGMLADSAYRENALITTEITDWETLTAFQPALGRRALFAGHAAQGLPVMVKAAAVSVRAGDEAPLSVLVGRLLNNDDDFVGRSFGILDGDYQHRATANTKDGMRVTGTFVSADSVNGDQQRPEIARAIQSGTRSYTVTRAPLGEKLRSFFAGAPATPTSYVITTPLFSYGGELVGAINVTNGTEKPRAERRRIVRAVALTSAVVLLSGIVLSYAVSWKLARPLTRFAGTVNEIALAGRMEASHLEELEGLRDDLAPVREYDGLRGAVAGLARAQYEKQREIERHVDELEQVVAERTEDLRAALREAENSNAARTRFLTNISHDVRTPLNSICGFSSLLRQELYGGLNGKQAEYVALIDDCARQVLRLFSDLLELAVSERGQLALRREKISPAELLNALVAQFAAQALGRSVTLTAEAPPDLPEIEGDRPRLTRALTNILDNALKYTPAGGQVLARAAAVRGGVALSVRDNGRGIAAEEMPRVFEEFYRVRDGGSEPEGFGLGLATARSIARLHGGFLEIESEPDLFTEVRIVLPV